jgi:hypothetical protein
MDFYKFWVSTGLPVPMRGGYEDLSAFSSRLGKLNGIEVTGSIHDTDPKKIVSSSLKPLTRIKHSINTQTARIRHAKPTRTNKPEPIVMSDSQPNQTTYPHNHDKRHKLIRKNDKDSSSTAISDRDSVAVVAPYAWSELPLRKLD